MSDSDEDKVLQTWLDLDAIQFPELPEVSQEPDYGALAGITADDWAVMISGGDPTEAAMGQQLARQARTIRRLFTAYFLAKGKAMRNGQAAADNCATCLVAGIEDGKREERARIVAALRENGGLGDMPNFTLRLDYACNVIADAIERGDL